MATSNVVPLPVHRKRKRAQKSWRHSGVTLGYIRDGVYWIDRTRGGQRYRVNTGMRTPEAAFAEYERWEKAGPTQYARPGEVREGAAWTEACKAFLRHKAAIEGRSEKYVKEVASQLALWGSYRGFASLDSFGQGDIESFLTDLREGKLTGRLVNERDAQGLTVYERDEAGNVLLDEKGRKRARKVRVVQEDLKRDASRNRYLAALKSLMTWARSRRPPLTANAADTSVAIGAEDRDTRPPEPVEPERWKVVGQHLMDRWALAQTVLLGSGLRWGELARLTVDDIRPGGLVVRLAKRRKGRTVPVSETVVRATKAMLEAGGVPDDSGSQMDHRLEAACRAAGVKRYTAHHLRHTYATTCLRNGMDVRTLQVRMGHKKLETTLKYLHALQAEEGETGFAPV